MAASGSKTPEIVSSTKARKPIVSASGSQNGRATGQEKSHQPVKPSEKRKAKAAITIQRFFHGWLQRHHFKISKKKALKRSANFNIFLKRYREHCIEIMKRHGEESPQVHLNFIEVNEYINKVVKFEINYQMTLPKGQDGLLFKELRSYFTKCELHPSSKEIDDAAHLIYPDAATFHEHLFSKKEVVDIALHLYVPKGTHMDVRKSTWLNPIIDGKEAFMLPTPKGLVKKTNVQKALSIVMDARHEREKELVEELCNQNEKAVASLSVQPTSSKKSKSKTRLTSRK